MYDTCSADFAARPLPIGVPSCLPYSSSSFHVDTSIPYSLFARSMTATSAVADQRAQVERQLAQCLHDFQSGNRDVFVQGVAQLVCALDCAACGGGSDGRNAMSCHRRSQSAPIMSKGITQDTKSQLAGMTNQAVCAVHNDALWLDRAHFMSMLTNCIDISDRHKGVSMSSSFVTAASSSRLPILSVRLLLVELSSLLKALDGWICRLADCLPRIASRVAVTADEGCAKANPDVTLSHFVKHDTDTWATLEDLLPKASIHLDTSSVSPDANHHSTSDPVPCADHWLAAAKALVELLSKLPLPHPLSAPSEESVRLHCSLWDASNRIQRALPEYVLSEAVSEQQHQYYRHQQLEEEAKEPGKPKRMNWHCLKIESCAIGNRMERMYYQWWYDWAHTALDMAARQVLNDTCTNKNWQCGYPSLSSASASASASVPLESTLLSVPSSVNTACLSYGAYINAVQAKMGHMAKNGWSVSMETHARNLFLRHSLVIVRTVSSAALDAVSRIALVFRGRPVNVVVERKNKQQRQLWQQRREQKKSNEATSVDAVTNAVPNPDAQIPAGVDGHYDGDNIDYAKDVNDVKDVLGASNSTDVVDEPVAACLLCSDTWCNHAMRCRAFAFESCLMAHAAIVAIRAETSDLTHAIGALDIKLSLRQTLSPLLFELCSPSAATTNNVPRNMNQVNEFNPCSLGDSTTDRIDVKCVDGSYPICEMTSGHTSLALSASSVSPSMCTSPPLSISPMMTITTAGAGVASAAASNSSGSLSNTCCRFESTRSDAGNLDKSIKSLCATLNVEHAPGAMLTNVMGKSAATLLPPALAPTSSEVAQIVATANNNNNAFGIYAPTHLSATIKASRATLGELRDLDCILSILFGAALKHIVIDMMEIQDRFLTFFNRACSMSAQRTVELCSYFPDLFSVAAISNGDKPGLSARTRISACHTHIAYLLGGCDHENTLERVTDLIIECKALTPFEIVKPYQKRYGDVLRFRNNARVAQIVSTNSDRFCMMCVDNTPAMRIAGAPAHYTHLYKVTIRDDFLKKRSLLVHRQQAHTDTRAVVSSSSSSSSSFGFALAERDNEARVERQIKPREPAQAPKMADDSVDLSVASLLRTSRDQPFLYPAAASSSASSSLSLVSSVSASLSPPSASPPLLSLTRPQTIVPANKRRDLDNIIGILTSPMGREPFSPERLLAFYVTYFGRAPYVHLDELVELCRSYPEYFEVIESSTADTVGAVPMTSAVLPLSSCSSAGVRNTHWRSKPVPKQYVIAARRNHPDRLIGEPDGTTREVMERIVAVLKREHGAIATATIYKNYAMRFHNQLNVEGGLVALCQAHPDVFVVNRIPKRTGTYYTSIRLHRVEPGTA